MTYLKRKAFTLIELLIVVAILGIMAMLIVTAIGANKTAAARDAVRKAQLSQIASALTVYEIEHGGVFPPPLPDDGTEFTSEGGSNGWIPGLAPDTLKTLPLDPKQSALTQLLAKIEKVENKPQTANSGKVAGAGSISIEATNDCQFRFHLNSYPADSSSPHNYFDCSLYANEIGHGVGSYQGEYLSYKSYRTYLEFDTSAIPDDATITTATLKLRSINSGNYPTVASFNLFVRAKNWTLPPEAISSYWTFPQGGSGLNNYWSTNVPPTDPLMGSFDTGILNSTPQSFTINLTSNLGQVNKSGNTKLVLSNNREESNQLPPQHEVLTIYSLEHPTAQLNPSLKPELTVNYTTPGGGEGESSPSPSPSPNVPEKHHYGYYVSADRRQWVLWATLENDDDWEINTKATSRCQEPTPAGTSFNFCMKSE